MMSRTFGAPAGAATAFGKSGLESFAVRPMTPWNGGSGTGSTGEPPVGGFAAGLSAAWRSLGIESVIAPSTTVSASQVSLGFIVNSSPAASRARRIGRAARETSPPRRAGSTPATWGVKRGCGIVGSCAPPVRSADLLDDRRLPAAVDDGLLAPIGADVQRESALRRWLPVRLLVLARRLVADVQRQRTIGVVLEVVVLGAQRIALEIVRREEVEVVVEGERPETLDRRRLALGERHDVLRGAIELGTRAVVVGVEVLGFGRT